MVKIAFIGPGLSTIPPKGWGALETVVWNLHQEVGKLGYETHIVNKSNPNEVMSILKALSPDIVHLHYGTHYQLMPYLPCRRIITSHDGSFKNSLPFHESVVRTFLYGCEFFCLTNPEKDFLIKLGIARSKIKLLPNGVSTKLFKRLPTSEIKNPGKSICIGKIDLRKRQSMLQSMGLDIDFVGQNVSTDFDVSSPNYLGQWDREQIYERITEYANFILLSESELQPLVCLEALSAGLGLVISKACAENLDTSLPFITVIPEEKIQDADYLRSELQRNAAISKANREAIFQYADSFDWSMIAKKYDSFIKQ